MMALMLAIYRRLTLLMSSISQLPFWNVFTRNRSAFGWPRNGVTLAVQRRSEHSCPTHHSTGLVPKAAQAAQF